MTIPWRGTTPEIASEDDSRYETPGGAQNKVNVSQEYLLHLLQLAVTGLSDGSEAAIARNSTPYGITYDWLKDRLDAADQVVINRGEINVKDFGAKDDWNGTTGTDNTAFFQMAIDVAFIVGGKVIIPPSETGYLIAGYLNLKTGVTLEGYNYSVGDKYGAGMENTNATVLFMTGGEGGTTGQGITLFNSSTIRNIKFIYPNQSKIASNIKLYPPTLKLFPNAGNDVTIENIFFLNSYTGIDATGAHERLTVNEVRGQPMFGIKIDNCYDVDRLSSIHFYPYWGGSTSDITTYSGSTMYNGIALDIGRCDNFQIDKFFAYGYYAGLRLYESAGGNSYGTLDNSGFDFCLYPIKAESTHEHALHISNSTVVVGDYFRGIAGSGIDAAGISHVMVSNCSFWCGNNGQMNISASGTSSVFVSNCQFLNWLGDQSIYISSSAAVSISNSLFKQTGNHIAYDVSATKGITAVGIRAAGGFTVYNPSGLSQQVLATTTP